MICSSCGKEISSSAVRCRFCRRRVDDPKKPLASIFVNKFSGWFFSGKGSSFCSWSFIDIILITLLIYLFILNDPFRTGRHVVDFLRLRYFIFTREPRLLHYLNIYINTIILKIVSFILVLALVSARGTSFWGRVVMGNKVKLSALKWLPLYVLACVIFRIINFSNPLLPNIPMNSVFPEARLIGNSVIIFSVIIIAPFVEEVLFRGYLYPAFNKYVGVYPAILLTSCLFTFAHYPHIKEDISFVCTIFTLSVIITYARAKTSSTWLAIAMHHIYNLVYVLVGLMKFFILKY